MYLQAGRSFHPPVNLPQPLPVLGHGWKDPETVDKKNGPSQRWLDETSPDARFNIAVSPRSI
jgi:hypothetical protein